MPLSESNHSPTRIAIVFEYPTLNGGERSMLAVIDGLSKNEDHKEFVAIAPPNGPLANALKKRGITHHAWQTHDNNGQRLSRDEICDQLLKNIRAIEPSLVHANSLATGRLLGTIASQLSVPTIAHIRDIIKLSKAAVRDLNANSRLIAVSEATRQFHVAQGFDEHKTMALHNGVDCNLFQPRPATGQLKKELGLSGDAFLIGTIGQIGLRKGQDILTQAAVTLKDRLPMAHYVLIGERHSSKQESIDFEQNIKATFASAGMADHLHCLGYRNDVSRLMNELNLLVHPAHQEPLGRVLLEAAASGLPVVVTDVGGTREIFPEHGMATLVEPNDANQLTDAIHATCNDQSLRMQMSKAAREQIENHFTIEHASQRLNRMWNDMLS